MEKTRRQIAREKATIGVYQNLLVDSSLEDILTFLSEETTLQNKESYQTLIEKHLKKGWKFERLSMMEKAILMIAACELLESDLPKTIVINEAVLNAKKFCDDDSYKFINGVLGQII